MAIGSYVEDGANTVSHGLSLSMQSRFSGSSSNAEHQIEILNIHPKPEADLGHDAPQYSLEYVKIAEAQASYPATRIRWEPTSMQRQSADLLASSGDSLRLWSLPSQSSHSGGNSITRSSDNVQLPPRQLTPLAVLSSSASPEHSAPLTSLDWNVPSPNLIITSSIDTTCTVWDILTLTPKQRFIAHDKAVFDVRFCGGSIDNFCTCGADGSVRYFDLRTLTRSSIIYEPPEKKGKHNSNFPVTFFTTDELSSSIEP